MEPLASLGPRLCIFGPSNSGKSTLADALGRKLGAPAIHLDRLYHLPHTDWEPRPPEDFARLHDASILGEDWVMDGNYTRQARQRLDRATGIIWLDTPVPGNLWRYARRTLLEPDRKGALDGGHDSLKWTMIRHIARVQPSQRPQTAALLASCPLPLVHITSLAALNRYYSHWDLER